MMDFDDAVRQLVVEFGIPVEDAEPALARALSIALINRSTEGK